MAFQVREARDDDVDTLIAWTLEEFRESEGANATAPDTVARGVRWGTRADRYFVCVEPAGERVGAMAVQRQWSDWSAGAYVVIAFVYVVPEWRRRGAFSCLLDHVQRTCAGPLSAQLRLMFNAANTAARLCYEARGFAPLPYVLYGGPQLKRELPAPPPLPVRFGVEVCVDSLDSVDAALAGGAHRLELCAGLAVGGLTPSLGLAKRVVARVAGAVPVMILVRPRPGSMQWSPDEVSLMEDDIVQLKNGSAVSGFVVGALDAQGAVDEVVTARLVEAAHPFPCTFHRAFDVVVRQSVPEAVAAVARAGCRALLSSGRHATALEGVHALAEMLRAAPCSLSIVAGAGVDADAAAALVRACPALWGVHGSFSAATAHDQSSLPGLDGSTRTTNALVVKAVVRALQQ